MFASIFNRTLSVYVEVSQKLCSGKLVYFWRDLKANTFRFSCYTVPVWLRTKSFHEYLRVFNITFTSFHTIASKIFSILSFLLLKRFFHKNRSYICTLSHFCTLFLSLLYRDTISFIFKWTFIALRRCFIKTNNQYLRSRPIYIPHVNIQLGRFIQTNIITTWRDCVGFKTDYDFTTLEIALGRKRKIASNFVPPSFLSSELINSFGSKCIEEMEKNKLLELLSDLVHCKPFSRAYLEEFWGGGGDRVLRHFTKLACFTRDKFGRPVRELTRARISLLGNGNRVLGEN